MYKKLLSLSRLFVVVVLISALLLTSACFTIVPNPTTSTTTTPTSSTSTTTTSTTPATYMLTVNLTGLGTVIKNPDQLNYINGTSVQLAATPDSGWVFTGWSGNLSGTANPATINMDTNKVVTAIFTQSTYILNKSVVGNGSIGLSNSGPYHYGDEVQLIATPAAGWTFANWSGDVASTNATAMVTMNSNKNVIANFIAVRYSLSISVSPPDGGSVSPRSNTYDAGTSVILTATPASGYRFGSWSGDISGTGPTDTIILDSNKSVVATFVRQFTLSTSVSPAGSGTIYLNPPGGIYDSGTGVSLTATAASGYTFDYWSGGASGTSATTTITMTSNQSMVANFVATMTTPPPAVTTVQIPTMGAVDVAVDTTFTWPAVVVAGQTVTYEFVIATENTFATPIVSATTLTNAYKLTKALTYNTQYWWRVRAVGATSWSACTTSFFTTEKEPAIIYSIIYYSMPPGALAGAWVTYANYLSAGQAFKGTVSLSGYTPSIDWSSTWTFAVYDPEDNLVDRKSYTFSSGAIIPFNYTASHAGTWKIKVDHASYYTRNLQIKILPTGWSRIANFP